MNFFVDSSENKLRMEKLRMEYPDPESIYRTCASAWPRNSKVSIECIHIFEAFKCKTPQADKLWCWRLGAGRNGFWPP